MARGLLEESASSPLGYRPCWTRTEDAGARGAERLLEGRPPWLDEPRAAPNRCGTSTLGQAGAGIRPGYVGAHRGWVKPLAFRQRPQDAGTKSPAGSPCRHGAVIMQRYPDRPVSNRHQPPRTSWAPARTYRPRSRPASGFWFRPLKFRLPAPPLIYLLDFNCLLDPAGAVVCLLSDGAARAAARRPSARRD